MIILIDLSLRSIAVAEKIQETLKRLWIDCRLGVVANRSSGDSRQVQASLEARGIELWGIIPEDPVLPSSPHSPDLLGGFTAAGVPSAATTPVISTSTAKGFSE